MSKKYKTNLPFLLVALVLSMLCLAYASVPIYRIFCKVTGYGGATKKSSVLKSSEIGKYKIKVRFSATTHNLPILFSPVQPHITVTPGVQKLAFYSAENTTDHLVSGTAVYNVSPPQVGKYFNKVACFCFTEQTFEPHKAIVMPVSFFIDPAIERDTTTMHIREITLSYIFFPSNKVPPAY
ncbi:cytochrome c oxidase assembly protein [Candidatus Anaplasma sp. TIGMIC]|uniref:cytochrome c oxidase assembly protein n=1 Tax=Candidatus Anaplasma sp. TIGMIC TaxID=3020713 RepID=UPI00232DBA56|nr:cytochrome c oxidase assembly protein [Candidatus Anaplasma sp. TIGMIC]MDB1135734.1 cytochrome c oxidase assembly protein [Candidatus Anaplasma sp. TIGMIC]